MKLNPAMVFGSHMVLQRNQPIRVWGTAAEGDIVRVCLDGNEAVSPVKGGQWRVELPAREAAVGLQMIISTQRTEEQIRFTDIAVGEVWLAGGQSNMQFELRYDIEAPTEIPAAKDPLIRFFDYPEVTMSGQVEFGRTEEYGFWRGLTPEDAPYYSAVGYYFARKLRAALNIPVGILGCNFGGSTSAAWISREEMLAVPVLRQALEQYEQNLDDLDWRKDEQMAMQRATADPAIKRRGDDKILMGDFSEMEALFGLQPKTEKDRPAPPTRFVVSPRSQNAPCVLFEQMLQPVAPYGIRGVIWYQGESDTGPQAAYYDESMKAVRRSWNKLWGRELPFFQVILAPFDHWGPMKNPNPAPISVVREMQMRLAKEEDGFFCANIMDCGAEDNIHPREKRPAGERLAMLARKHIYGEEIQADAPLPAEIRWQEGVVTVRFTNAEGGLHIEGEAISALKLLIDGGEVVPQCTLQGDTMIVAHEKLCGSHHAELSFAQENYCLVNIYNAAHIPVFPFAEKHQY